MTTAPPQRFAELANTSYRLLSFEQYDQAAEALHVLSGIVLVEFVRRDDAATPRDQIARNFIARADTTVRGIFRLWEIGDQTDCWILHRALLDRLFHLYDLNQKDQFGVFNDWSFKTLYEAADRLRSDPDLRGQIDGLVEELTPERKSRYQHLAEKPPNWRRPKAEDTARGMGLVDLYRYGYDYASRYVHPMANDGLADFQVITRLEPKPDSSKADIVVLSNSILVASMILQEALNASSLAWMAVVYNAIDGVRNFLIAPRPEHHLQIAKVSELFAESIPLAKRRRQRASSLNENSE
jgi:hypothetical protein